MPESKLWMYQGTVVGATGPRQWLVAFLRSEDPLEIRARVGRVLEMECLVEIEMREIEEFDYARRFRGQAAKDALETGQAGELGYFFVLLA